MSNLISIPFLIWNPTQNTSSCVQEVQLISWHIPFPGLDSSISQICAAMWHVCAAMWHCCRLARDMMNQKVLRVLDSDLGKHADQPTASMPSSCRDCRRWHTSATRGSALSCISCVGFQRSATTSQCWPAAKPLDGVAGSETLSTASPDSVMLVTCAAQCEPVKSFASLDVLLHMSFGLRCDWLGVALCCFGVSLYFLSRIH